MVSQCVVDPFRHHIFIHLHLYFRRSEPFFSLINLDVERVMNQPIDHGKVELFMMILATSFTKVSSSPLSYSIKQSVDDMDRILSELVPSPFHLLGHSYGGTLAYEYLATVEDTMCKSLILSNAPQNMRRANEAYDHLQLQDPFNFWSSHVCRVGTPRPLQDALENLGTVWGGMDDVVDFVAQPSDASLPPTLLISGECDFAKETSGKLAWAPLIPDSEFVEMKDCAHYPFYEDGEAYARFVLEFWKKVEDQDLK